MEEHILELREPTLALLGAYLKGESLFLPDGLLAGLQSGWTSDLSSFRRPFAFAPKILATTMETEPDSGVRDIGAS